MICVGAGGEVGLKLFVVGYGPEMGCSEHSNYSKSSFKVHVMSAEISINTLH